VAEANHEQYQVIRIALVSPSDVREERGLANEVVKDINTHLAMPFGFVLELRQWEDVYPALHEAGPQGHIDTKLNIAECDYVVGILWHRFGTPTPSGETGTEHEVRQAHALWQKHQRPQLMLYVNNGPYSPSTPEEADQWGKVLRFKQEFPDGLVHDYTGADEFSKRFRNHFDRIIADRVNTRRSTTTTTPASHCSVTGSVRTVRGEGISELIGEISLTFPTSPDAMPIACNIEVTLNTNVTNKLNPGNIHIGTVLRRQDGLSTYEVKGRSISVSRVLFENVILNLRGPNGTCEYQIVGLRANALMIGYSVFGNEGKQPDTDPILVAFVHIQGARNELIEVVNPAVSVGTIKPSIRFEIVPPVPDTLFSRKTGINVEFARSPSTVSPNVNLWVRFVEKYPGAFSTAAEEPRYMRELGQERIGIAGIRFWVCFSVLSDNITVYATTRDRESISGPENTVLIPNEYHEGSSQLVSSSVASSDVFPIAPLGVSNGYACATWEWISTKIASTVARSVTFGFVFVALPDSTLIGKTLVSGGLAPASTVQTASTSAPVPRFGVVSLPQVAFNVVWE
jgi:hypothetical protein